MIWLILALVVLPFLHLNVKIAPIESMHILGIIVLGVSIAGAKVFQKNKPLGIGCFCVLASYLVTVNSPLVREAFQALVFFLIWTIFYLTARESKLKPLLWAIAIAGTINALYLGCQALGFDFVFKHLNPRPGIYGFLGSPGNSGVFQAICLPVALSVNPILGAIVFAGLLLAHSTVSIAAGIIGAGFYLWFRYQRLKKFMLLLPILTLAIILLADRPRLEDFRVRFKNVAYTLKFIRKGEMLAYRVEAGKQLTFSNYKINYTPFGYGLGSFKATMPFVSQKEMPGVQYSNARMRHPHNEYTYILFELGPIALIVMIWIVLSALFKDTNPAIRGSILALAVGGLGYFPLLIPVVTIQSAVLFGLNKEVNDD